ncbi:MULTISPECIES: DUF411 domain-containing protein [unclassified Mesorhizobium]|uniref:DUF411 domain-containing protein n=1 Tax=unclassified Mesorhizobium TaxID=325217 RepID=UPI000F762AED|nr:MULTISPECIES: DUF411 domain-containing protein [unclassified Mesorhizobium]AZO67111.1 CopG family transcriptional regulator [Mesorhizobium sp. M6A.T.Cr.TU.016.01.1.1]RWP55459.1 MAG: CopG family transcriptional regulator [Mesorhizobium sp.]RWQ77283.1 MAG: CopG family transcriptional regulator [Mesorhizobium sp.]
MKPTYAFAAFALAIATPMPALAATINAIMYKNPQCSCCEAYAAYLEQNGFKVDIKPVNNLSQISSDAGVPTDLEGCHTLMVDGYVIDGLVPIDIVRKLLTERPAISGITLAGMPTGAPGMGGEKSGTWTIYAFTKDGNAPTVYATR